MITSFLRKDEKLKKQTQEQEYINKELQIACNIQQALLPKDEDELGSDDVKVEGQLIPAKAVGGDLYNAFIRDDKLYFCIGDVTGKGIPAAIIMAITQTLFRNIAQRESNPARIMGDLNQAACRNNKANIFVTLFIGVLDLPTGHLRYCNAGHEVPIIIEPSTVTIELLNAKPNLPIGIFEDFSYEMQEMYFGKNGTLFLYTDGLTEAKNAQKKLLGREHVMELVAAASATDPKAMVESVIDQCRKFVGNTEQSDDLTLLAISYMPREEQYILDETLTLPNDVKEVATLSTFVKGVMARLNIGKPLVSKLRLAVEEAVVNVMEYAYPAGTKGDVSIRVTSDGEWLRFVISDRGISFNPTEASKADTTLSAEERPVGGLGIRLVRELMDSINYERTDGMNVLTLTKAI
jgi:sigma-B regulation protein RsbU (phosphoserine phosphatase)